MQKNLQVACEGGSAVEFRETRRHLKAKPLKRTHTAAPLTSHVRVELKRETEPEGESQCRLTELSPGRHLEAEDRKQKQITKSPKCVSLSLPRRRCQDGFTCKDVIRGHACERPHREGVGRGGRAGRPQGAIPLGWVSSFHLICQLLEENTVSEKRWLLKWCRVLTNIAHEQTIPWPPHLTPTLSGCTYFWTRRCYPWTEENNTPQGCWIWTVFTFDLLCLQDSEKCPLVFLFHLRDDCAELPGLWVPYRPQWSQAINFKSLLTWPDRFLRLL